MFIVFVLTCILAICLGLFWLMGKARNIVLKIVFGLLGGCLGTIFLLLFAIAAFFKYEEPPSIATLAKHFTERRATLQQILIMSDQDVHFSRIDPTFVNYGYIDGTVGGQAMQGQKGSPLSQDRWNAYRSLFSKIKLSQGFQRDSDGNVYFLSGSFGLLNRGHSTGYLFCRDPGAASSISSPFEPCTLSHQDSGSQSYGTEPRREAYSFIKVAEHWFVFDQGPS
jgi:multisubunit Na+/H+ antiporter MnhC subunit